MKFSSIWKPVRGMVDAGFSSLATFVAGWHAVRTLDIDDLALFSLYFAGAVLLMVIPQEFVLAPIRMKINFGNNCVTLLRHDLWRSRYSLILVMLLVPLAGLPLFGSSSAESALILAISAAAYCLTGTLQQHVRSTLHIISDHGRAAMVSIATFLSTVGTIWIAQAFTDTLWLNPLSALSVGNLSVLIVWNLGRRRDLRVLKSMVLEPVTSRLMYLGSPLSIQSATYIVTAVMAVLLGGGAVAKLEAARVAAAPVLVLATGVMSYLVPRAVRFIAVRNHKLFRKSLNSIHVSIFGISIFYGVTLFALGPVVSSVMGRSIDPALAASRAVAFGATSASNSLSWAALALQRPKRALGYSFAGAVAGIVTSIPLALLVGPFAVPLSESAASVVRFIGIRSLLKESQRTFRQ